MRGLVIVLTLFVSVTLSAQVQMRPTDPPIVNAASESWYQLREPIQYAGDLFYPAGPALFFNGNVMVRTGHYNGIPLYADTTLEPYSIVFVPIGRGQMQPYERLRQGDLAGTVGSRPPSFPIRLLPQQTAVFAAATGPTTLPAAIGAIGVYSPEVASTSNAAAPAAASVPPVNPTTIPPQPVVTLLRPENNDGIWVRFQDRKWVNSGAAIPLESSVFTKVGEYAGFPVFKRRNATDDVIYLPTRAGLIAPYRLKT
jgi:hypothetical protein